MSVQVSSLSWVPTSDQNGDYVAAVNCDFTVNSTYNIVLIGTDPNGDSVTANYACIDNTPNNGIVNITYGPFSFQVPPYTRRTFEIPDLVNNMTVVGTAGVCVVTFLENQADIPDEQNLSAINASTKTVAYTPSFITSSRTMVQADNNSYLIVSGGSLIYTLLPVATAGEGFWVPKIINLGTGYVVVNQNTGDEINGKLTGITMAPGDFIDLFCDGSQWEATGNITASNAVQAYVKFAGQSSNGACAILGNAYNVASVTRTNTGSYTIAFQRPMNSGNYVVSGTIRDTSAYAHMINGNQANANTANNCYIVTSNGTASPIDSAENMVMIIGG